MRTRRGLSTVVGMVFAIIALSTTLAYITYSMNTLDQYNQAVLSKNQQSLNQGQEKFQVTGATFVNNNFNITVVNTGNLPINFTKLWVLNTTALSTDKVYYFSLTNSFVTPGGILKNIGQSVNCPPSPTCSFMTTPSYHIKLVTSRGNTQEFNINSISSTPLNIQMLTTPPTVPSGFKTQLVMIVTNNSTGVLANVVPNTPVLWTGNPLPSNANCALGALSSNSYPTLQVGSIAVFTWPLTITGNPGQICTYTAQLQGSSQTVRATVTSTVVSLVPATTYSQYSGVLTINYTSFRWTQTGSIGWNTGWKVANQTQTAIKINMTNNNSTGTFYISKNTLLAFYNSRNSPSLQPTRYYIVNYTSTPITSISSTAYGGCNGQSDYCLGIPPGQTVTLYLESSTISGTTATQFGGTDTEPAFLLVFGKFASSQTGTGTPYAQNIPYIAVIIT